MLNDKIIKAHSAQVCSLSYSQTHENVLYSSSKTGTISIWNTNEFVILKKIKTTVKNVINGLIPIEIFTNVE